MWRHVAGDIDPHVTGKSIFRKHCHVKLRELRAGAFNSPVYDRWMYSDASHVNAVPKSWRRKFAGFSIAAHRNYTWNDNGDLEKKIKLFHREVTLIKMRVNASRGDDVRADFMPEIQTFVDNALRNNNVATMG